MAIQWFPGHMHVTKKAITERIKDIDVVIELLDARLPGSSANPLLASLTGHRPTLKVLNKQDLADPARTRLWLDHYNARQNTRAIELDAGEKAPAQRLTKACRELAPNRGSMDKPLKVLICGIPNVGKSTLINTITGKKAAKTGNEPGITKLEQRILLAKDFYLYDTPGMLWPKILVEEAGYNLAASGAVGRNAYDEEEVALELIQRLKQAYPESLMARYRLDGSADEIRQQQDDALLSAVARYRGAVMAGGRPNLQKAAEVVLNDFRDASLGRITLESPEEFTGWLAQAERAEAQRLQDRAHKVAKDARAILRQQPDSED